jgi:hypothetical protein
MGGAAGNARSDSVRLIVPEGRPLSAGDQDDSVSLSQLERKFSHCLNRPWRRFGGWQRGSAEPEYLAGLAEHFHALRPLTFVLETRCLPVSRYLDHLLASVACRRLSPTEAAQQPQQRRHFDFWIDGDGECCRLSDEQGQPLEPSRLLVLLAEYLLVSHPGAAVVVEEHTPAWAIERLQQAGASVFAGGSSRAAMHAAMRRHRALIAGGYSGRYWLDAGPPLPDALHVLALVLCILSQSDRPLSSIAPIA